MAYTQEQLNELNVLNLFDLSNHQEGIKIHSSADPSLIAAALRLYEKGLITQQDGGYLTHLGIEAAEFAQTLLSILTPEQQAEQG